MDKTIIICCLVMMMMGPFVDAFTHIVGGSHGWRVPENTTFFDQWAKPRTFGVGDRLGISLFILPHSILLFYPFSVV